MATVFESGVLAGGRGTEQPLSEILAQISRGKDNPRQRLQTPPPSYDAGLRSLDYVQMPQRVRGPIIIRNLADEYRQLLPMPNLGVGPNCAGGSMSSSMA